MTDNRLRNQQPPRRFNANRLKRTPRKSRIPFWLPAPGFYVLTVAVSVGTFFVVWAILQEGGENSPWIAAGIGSSCVLASGVVLREIILRKARNRYLRAERQLDENIERFVHRGHNVAQIHKLSLKRNAQLIEQLQRKSEAARTLSHLPDGHWEVFELCNEYLSLNEFQMQHVGVGSPRLAALRRGRDIAEGFRKHHLLSWVEIETKSFTEKANVQPELSDKINLAQTALLTIESALEFYPEEEKLIDSKSALKEYIGSVKISHLIENAEKEAFKENYRKAVSQYRDALFYLAREEVHSSEKEIIAARINAEIDRIRKLEKRLAKKVEKIKKPVVNDEDN